MKLDICCRKENVDKNLTCTCISMRSQSQNSETTRSYYFLCMRSGAMHVYSHTFPQLNLFQGANRSDAYCTTQYINTCTRVCMYYHIHFYCKYRLFNFLTSCMCIAYRLHKQLYIHFPKCFSKIARRNVSQTFSSMQTCVPFDKK